MLIVYEKLWLSVTYIYWKKKNQLLYSGKSAKIGKKKNILRSYFQGRRDFMGQSRTILIIKWKSLS